MKGITLNVSEDQILEYVRQNFHPDEVFDEDELELWAAEQTHKNQKQCNQRKQYVLVFYDGRLNSDGEFKVSGEMVISTGDIIEIKLPNNDGLFVGVDEIKTE